MPFRRRRTHRTSKSRRQVNPETLELRTLLTNVTLIDINQVEADSGSELNSFINVGDETFFVADDGVHGAELWKTDLTSGGTELVKDINPGPAAGAGFQASLVINGTLFFTADDGQNGFELWKSDGTDTGTVMVKDISAGPDSTVFGSFTEAGGELFFFADDGVNGTEVWASDGTDAGTRLVRDLNPNGGLGASGGVAFRGEYFFGNFDRTTDTFELWKTDGTSNGTDLVREFPNDERAFSRQFVVNGDAIYFPAGDDTNGVELWKSDGTTSGTTLVKDIQSGGGDSWPLSLTSVDGNLFFTAIDGSGRELWVSDGTEGGTNLVKDIESGNSTFGPTSLTAVGDRLFFSADGVDGEELWISDGTEAGTVQVKDIHTGTNTFGPNDSNPSLLEVAGDVVYFSAVDSASSVNGGGQELWRSDGTEAGTFQVADLRTDGQREVNRIHANGSTILFSGSDGENGFELWKSDGTSGGTELVKDIDTVSTNGSQVGDRGVLGDELLFLGNDGSSLGNELWISDTTKNGTRLLKDINPNGDSNAGGFTTVGDQSFFTANDGVTGTELWVTDGTESGTRLVKDIYQGDDEFPPSPNLFEAVGNTLFFVGETEANGRELWKTDGTESGTVLVKDINPGPGRGVDFTSGVVLNGELFFVADTAAAGRELWKSDGTEAGTVLVKDIQPGPGDSIPRNLTVVGDTLFFSARATTGNELWKSDGTEDGTVLVKDINPFGDGITQFGGSLFDEFNGNLLFEADDGTTGNEVWISDGTEDGTVLVANIADGRVSSDPDGGVELNGEFFFSARTSEFGEELWKTDGTPSGTELVADLNPGGSSGVILFGTQGELAAFDDAVYFRGSDGTGPELWKTDGTEAGTELVADILPGIGGSFPFGITEVADELMFVAGGEGGAFTADGRELYRLGADTPEPSAELIDVLAEDENSNGLADPGDTIEYTVTLDVGPFDVTGLLFSNEVDNNTALVPGSLTVSQGNITRGNNGGQNVGVNFGNVDANTIITISYSVIIDNQLPDEVTTISTQGTVSGSNFDAFQTDDPDTGAAADPTATVVQNSGTGPLEFSISDASAEEGEGLVFTISLNRSPDEIVGVQFVTSDGTGANAAIADDDYFGVGGAFTFNPGEVSKTLTVNTIDDDNAEGTESFFVSLTSASGANIADGVGQGQILDNDEPMGCIEGLESGVTLIGDGVVLIVGTDGNDKLFTSESKRRVRVTHNRKKTDFEPDEVNSFIICGFDGADQIKRKGSLSTRPALIDGGAGPDKLFGGKGDDEILGGTGRDIIKGKQGDDTLSGGGGPDKLIGQAGDDILNGDAGDDQLVGGSGDNILNGGRGDDRTKGGKDADFTIGGEGEDRVEGGGGDDILIAGSTNLTNDELKSIMLEWTNTQRTREQRIANIRGDDPGNRLNGNAFLDSTTVSDDTQVDQLKGASGLDWFFASVADMIDRLDTEDLDLF